MAWSRARKCGVIALVAAIVLIAGGVVAFRVAVESLRRKVVEALGPGTEIAALHVGRSSVEVEGLRIRAGRGWPAGDALRADRVIVAPSMLTLLSGRARIGSITIVKPYLSAVRTRDGRIRAVPSLVASPWLPLARTIGVTRVTIAGGVVDLFDTTVSQPAWRIRLEQVYAIIEEMAAPMLAGKNRFEVAAVVKGVHRHGRAHISGWAEVTTRDASVRTVLRSVDLIALQPYLVRAGETRVQRGALDLDLDLDSEIREHRFRAPGRVRISDLEFAPTRGVWDTFMGVQRTAVVSFLKDKDGAIDLDFVLEGDLDNPDFVLQEALTKRIASAVAERLGVSIRGVVEGVGGAIRDFFGGRKKP